MENSFTEALQKKGFSVVEVISPCPALYGRMNRQPTGLDQMKYYRENSVIQHGADTRDADIDLNGKIIVGKFLDIDRPTFLDSHEKLVRRVSGDDEKKPPERKKAAATK
jgi:2-oxoglutarate ferredoxin oxidoreductase subunit beta